MDVPLSWIRDYVRLTLPAEEIAERLTFAGLEVEAIDYLGLPQPVVATESASAGGRHPATGKYGDLPWDLEKIVVGEVLEVMVHPNADRLVLCRLKDGKQIHTVLTGAPNLFPYKGRGPLETPLKVAYAREGARLYDGHQPGRVATTLQRMKIRGVESYSMICSEKELGISEEHEGVMILPEDAPTGTPLAAYLGDVVLSLKINPNMARNASMLGVAREIAALSGARLRPPSYRMLAQGPSLRRSLRLEIRRPDLNPRFTAALIRDVQIGPSPAWMQWRLQRAGMRPINNVVDITNYVMFETGQPLHAFDWDVLEARAGDGPVAIHTRLAKAGERLTTLDGVTRELDDFTILVCDRLGPLSIAGVMGGSESEVSDGTVNVLLEGAAWDYVSIRRTVQSQKLPSEAAFRFSRGVHSAMTARAVARAAELMRTVAHGKIARDLVDAYPGKMPPVKVDLPIGEVERALGEAIPPRTIRRILTSLEFQVEEVEPHARAKARARSRGRARLPETPTLRVTVPDHRLDIGKGEVGRADLIEEIARIYGYANIPEAQVEDLLPPQRANASLEQEEHLRDLLAGLGLQEVVTYRLTSREREAGLPVEGDERREYVTIANPIVPERSVMRRSLLVSVLEASTRNAPLRDRLALFEVGPVFLPEGDVLPHETVRLAIVVVGVRQETFWAGSDSGRLDFFDLKGIVEALAVELHLPAVEFEAHSSPAFHPGKCALLRIGGQEVGRLGELHPRVAGDFGLGGKQVQAAEINFDLLRGFLPERYPLHPVSAYPPVLEDLAVVVQEEVPAGRLLDIIRRAGAPLLREVRVFDLYRGGQIKLGMKSLAFSLIYQSEERTLTDEEVAEVRVRIISQLEGEAGAQLRGPALTAEH